VKKIAFVTLVYARTKKEKNDIVKTLRYLNTYGLPIFAANEKNAKYPLAQETKNLSNVKLLRASGISQRVKLAGKEAAKVADYIFYLEGDKYQFSRQAVAIILKKIGSNAKGIWLPGRTAKSFERYPKYQKIIERGINNVMSATVGINGDYCYGPRIFPAKLIKYFDKPKINIDWGWQSFVIVLGRRLKMPVKFIYSDLTCPPDFNNDSEVIKLFRLEGFCQYLIGIEEALKIKL